MRNLKKFLALVLATMMLLSVAVISTSAADDADYTEAANRLAALQVMKGNEKGDLMLENGVTRYQAALFFVQTLTGETDVATWNADKKSANFTDVVEYGTAIDYANGIGIVKGRGNGVFGYNDAITYQDMLVMAVRALGYETADMSYPYGYILAAQKLGLTDNVDLVNYKAALTRGETAQIIWDMLNTQVAVVDPLTDKVYYPEANETTVDGKLGYYTENSLGKFMPREELIVDSELAGDKITVVITDFTEGDEEEETVDTLTVTSADADITALEAADLGITVDTAKVTYMGLPVEIYINVAADDFDDAAYEDGDAAVVFATFPEYTVVENLSADGDIKYVVDVVGEGEDAVDKSYLSLAGNKYKAADYNFVTYEFVDGAWDEADTKDVTAIFTYDEDADVVYAGDNTYGKVAYRVIESGDDDVKGTVELLYTAYEFGQYNVREINEVKYTVVGVYEADANYVNLDEEKSVFTEYLVDGIGVATKKINVNTEKVSGTKGEAASTVVVEGEAVEAGDFMFYNYNAEDNILTVAMNCGKFQTGRLNTHSSTNKTVKINGTNYEFGFAGNYACDFEAEYSAEAAKAYMSALEAGKDNVQFLVVDGKIVYITETEVTSNNSTLDFAIVTLDAEIMADLLDMTASKYEAALTEDTDLYVEDGEVKVAMMNLETGKWELVTVAAIASDWVAEDEEFETVKDVANAVEYAEIIGLDSKYGTTVAEFKALVDSTLVAVAAVEDGAYTLAETYYTVEGDDPATEEEEESYIVSFFVSGTADENGISFSNTSAATNKITADDDVDAERVTVDEETVIIVVDVLNGVAGSRVGVQSKDNSYTVNTVGAFLAASSDLIVLVTVEEPESTRVADWADAAAANSDENWYIVTATTGVEVEANEDEETWTVTYTNLYDMKAMAMVESIQTVVEDIDAALEVATWDILFKTATDELELIVAADVDFDAIMVEVANDNEDKLTYTALTGDIEFTDADTIKITAGDDVVVSDVDATKVNMTVVTLNLTELDFAEYDFDEAVTGLNDTEGDVEIAEGVFANYFEINLDLVNEINEPTEGVFDENAFDTFLVPVADADDYTDAAELATELYAAYNYDAEEGVLNIVVYKLLAEVIAD